MKIEREVELLQERNQKVEADKAWETSTFRIVTIACITYTIIASVFFSLEVAHPFSNALIPPIGYLVSVQSLPFLKRWWIRTEYKKY